MATTYTDPFAVGTPAYNLAQNTALSDIAALPNWISVANRVNAANRTAQQQANEARLGPQGVATQATLLENAQREAQGLLDPQTEAMLQQSIAESGAASGFGVDSANLASAYRRALGLDITATEQAGQKNYLDLLAANPSAPIFDLQAFLTNPGQYANVAANTPTTPDPTSTGAGGGGVTPTIPTTTTATGGAPSIGGGGLRTAPSRVVPTAAEAGLRAAGAGAGYPTTTYNAPLVASAGGSTLAWSGQDWSDLFNNPYTATPENTVYNPFTDSSEYNYGLPSWYPTTYGNTTLLMPENTVFNPETNTSDYTYGLPSWDTSYEPAWDTAPSETYYPTEQEFEDAGFYF